MSSDKVTVYERIFKLLSSIFKMVVDGVREPEKLAEALQSIVDTATTYLRQLFSDVVVAATSGTESMPGLSASGHPTAAMMATIWVMILNGRFAQLFGSLGVSRRRWSRSQVAIFVHNNPDKLRGGGYGNFFELEDGSVADVGVDGGVWRADVDEFAYDDVWDAEDGRRVVSLQ